MHRCHWVNLDNPLYVAYHDDEWGVPVYEDTKLFEFIVLEGAQSGLSWETILNRREGYRTAFCNFDPRKVSKLRESTIEKLYTNPEIIRHKGKIHSVVTNAKVILSIQKEFGSMNAYLWQWVDNRPLLHTESSRGLQIAKEISFDLKKRGVKFFGPTICFAFMQGIGMINDHSPECFKYTK